MPGLLPGRLNKISHPRQQIFKKLKVSIADVIQEVVDERHVGIATDRLDSWPTPGIVCALRNPDAVSPVGLVDYTAHPAPCRRARIQSLLPAVFAEGFS